MISLFGNFDKNRKYIEDRFDTRIKLRDNHLEISGEEVNVRLSKSLLESLLAYLKKNQSLDFQQIKYQADMLERENKDVIKGLLDEVLVARADGKPIKPKTLGQKSYIDKIRSHDVVFGIGPAGTGKTYLAVAMAVKAFKAGAVDRIILTRPAVEAGESLGFLPGDLQDKVDPYLRPLYDGLFDILGHDTYQNFLEKGLIEVAPLAYMRGRTLDRSFVILDEAQNTTQEQMKMFLTRLGFGSKAIITGDKTQVDLPRGKRSGLRAAESILRNVEGIAFMEFSSVDVVRHPLVQRIIDAYEKDEQRRLEESEKKQAGSAKKED